MPPRLPSSAAKPSLALPRPASRLGLAGLGWARQPPHLPCSDAPCLSAGLGSTGQDPAGHGWSLQTASRRPGLENRRSTLHN